MKIQLRDESQPGWEPRRRWPQWLVYAFALLITGATLLLREHLGVAYGDRPLLILFQLPIILSAYLGGLGPGLVSTAVAALSVQYFLIPPANGLSNIGAADFAQWMTLIVNGVLVSVLSEALHSSRRQAETSRLQYAVTLAGIGDAVIATDLQGCITFLNKEAERLTGWTARDVLGKPLASELHMIDEKTRRPVDPVKRTLESEKSAAVTGHSLLLVGGDREIEVEDRGSVIKRADGAQVGMVLVLRDCSDKRKAETALRKSEEQLRAMFELASVGMSLADPETGRFERVNDRLCSITGYSSEELVGMRFLEITHPEDRDRDWEAFQRVMRGEATDYRNEKRYVRKDGTVVWVNVNVTQFEDNDGRPVNSLGVIEDITERKRAEEDRVRVEALLRQAQKMEALGTLAGGIAHDFNNILAAIGGFTELCLYKVPEGESARRDLEQVLKASSRAADLVRQILAFSRQVEQERKPVQLGPIVEEALKLLRSTLPTTVEIRREIRLGPDEGVVLADSTQIHQVLMNLCTNAAHAMRAEGGILSVRLFEVADASFLSEDPDLEAGPYVCLTVSDTGHGMDTAVMERIFDPYFTTKGPGEGTGLGLSVVQGIVKSHGGTITVSGEPGRGTTFRVFLPKLEDVVEAEAGTVDALPTGSERIFFVDDEKPLAELGKEMLESLGYHVTTATNSLEALETFKTQPHSFDLVISDMTMPGLTGKELLERILSLRNGMPTVLCTGFSYVVSEKHAREAGIRGFLMKPYTRAALAKTVREALGNEAPAEQRGEERG